MILHAKDALLFWKGQEKNQRRRKKKHLRAPEKFQKVNQDLPYLPLFYVL